MKRVLSVSCLLLLLAALPSCSSSKRGPEGTQEQFGVKMAKMNLWREALFRFKRAVEMNPADAQAHNNLAVAYEANGEFDAAAKEYREAMRLDKSNQYIQKNYSRLVEFNSRNKKRQRSATTTAKSPAESAATPATGTAAAKPVTPGSTPPATTGTQEPPPTLQGIGGSGATPASKPAAVPPMVPSTPPPDTTPPPPSEPVKSGGRT